MRAALERFDDCVSFLEKIGMRARPHEDDGVAIQTVDQQKIAADLTLAVVCPITFERVILPLGPERERRSQSFRYVRV